MNNFFNITKDLELKKDSRHKLNNPEDIFLKHFKFHPSIEKIKKAINTCLSMCDLFVTTRH